MGPPPHHYPYLQQILITGKQVSLLLILLPGSGSAPLSPWVGAALQMGLLSSNHPSHSKAPFLKHLCLTLAGTGMGERNRGQCWPIVVSVRGLGGGGGGWVSEIL